jgi:uncharacterized Fe-S cluster-containing radical SAM superfamily protein
MDARHAEHDEQRDKFYALLDKGQKSGHVAAGFGTHQWSDATYNIMQSSTNCANDCAYCYVKGIKHRFQSADLEDLEMRMDTKKVTKRWAKVRAQPKLIMFPSSHDIFPSFVDDYILVAKKILAAGHDLLLVSKPRLECMDRISAALTAAERDHVVFRLTITSCHNEDFAEWEHMAPLFAERLAALRLLHERGFKTSVSAEPCLSDPRELVPLVDEFVSEEIWIGEMSGMPIARHPKLAALYSNWRPIIADLRSNPKIHWKNSVMERVLR